jgi:hypothetical protein
VCEASVKDLKVGSTEVHEFSCSIYVLQSFSMQMRVLSQVVTSSWYIERERKGMK